MYKFGHSKTFAILLVKQLFISIYSSSFYHFKALGQNKLYVGLIVFSIFLGGGNLAPSGQK